MNPTIPGVSIHEIPTLPASIVPIATAIPAFIGYTHKRPIVDGQPLPRYKPHKITSFTEYMEKFGVLPNDDWTPNEGITVSVIDNIITEVSRSAISPHILQYAIQMYFENGGSDCYISSIGGTTDGTFPGTVDSDALKAGLDTVGGEDEPTLIVMPEAGLPEDTVPNPNIPVNGLTATDYHTRINEALTQCRERQDRFVIIDAKGESTDEVQGATLENVMYGAVYHPFLRTSIALRFKEADVTVNIDGTSGTLSGLITNDPTTTRTQLYNRIKAEIRRQLTVILPPSSAVAGIYARVDRNKGVWKSPANEVLNYTIETNTKVTPKRHGELNVVPGSGRSINVIRAIPGRGIRVMGARTLDGNSNEFRYVSVRRLFTFIEQSAKAALLDQVFENNSAVTWLRVKSMIDSFLTRIWRDGALFGAKPEDAFFVNVGRETMSNEDILNGILRVRIGLSAVRPAEFIVLEFSHFIN